jgi:hypothetical protein
MTRVRWSAAFEDPGTMALVRALITRGTSVTADHRGPLDILDIDFGDRVWLTARAAEAGPFDVQVIDLAATAVGPARGTAPCAVLLREGAMPPADQIDGLGLLDDIWARTDSDRDALVAMGVPAKRVWVCPAWHRHIRPGVR